MNLKEIKNFLNDIFSKPLGDGKVRHIVFWYDENEDFTEEIDEFDLDGVELIKLNENNAFYTKYYIEKENVDGNILVYSNMKKTKPQEDWLYDILSYSEEFSTDRATVIMRELKVNNPYLKEAFTFYNTFFKNKDRLAAFRNLGIQDYTEEKVHIGVLAVLTKTKIMNFEDLTELLVPIGVCVALPISIVYLILKRKIISENNKKEIILAALEKNADVNIEELVKKTSAPDKLLKEKLLKKLQWGLMTIVLSIGLFIYAIFVGDADELKLYVIGSVALLAIGVSLLFTYLMGKKMLAKEMEAEEQNLRQS